MRRLGRGQMSVAGLGTNGNVTGLSRHHAHKRTGNESDQLLTHVRQHVRQGTSVEHVFAQVPEQLVVGWHSLPGGPITNHPMQSRHRARWVPYRGNGQSRGKTTPVLRRKHQGPFKNGFILKFSKLGLHDARVVGTQNVRQRLPEKIPLRTVHQVRRRRVGQLNDSFGVGDKMDGRGNALFTRTEGL